LSDGAESSGQPPSAGGIETFPLFVCLADMPEETAPLPQNLVQVPVVRQRSDYSCGPAAALALLRFWCPDRFADVDECALHDVLRTSDARGTEPEPMVALLRRSGLEAEYRHGDVTIADLERAVDAREPPIVDLQAWREKDSPWSDTWDAGHYVTMVGYDRDRLYFADPSTMTPHGYAFMPRGELDERWHDLAGDHDEPLRRMAIFARGKRRWSSDLPPPPGAMRLG
jgi:predicted double-glycine peptidase